MTDADQKLLAMQAVLRWMFARLIETAKDPRSAHDDFGTFMEGEADILKEGAALMLNEGKIDAYSNMIDAISEFADVKKMILESVKIG